MIDSFPSRVEETRKRAYKMQLTSSTGYPFIFEEG
jgi:hypothetical protein